jgi:hypothetical protein
MEEVSNIFTVYGEPDRRPQGYGDPDRRPQGYGDPDRRLPPGYGDPDRRQPPGPSPNIPMYPPYPSRERPREEEMEDFARPGPARPGTLFPNQPDYPQYPVTSGAFPNLPMAPAVDYGLGRGRGDPFSVPRSEYESHPAGRSATIQSLNQGQYPGQPGITSPTPYQDPRTGQIIYPPTSGGRGYGAADGRHY